MNPEISAALRADFEPEKIGHLPKITCPKCREGTCSEHTRKNCKTCGNYLGKHIHIQYVGHAHVRERLLDVDTTWNWEPMALDGMGLPALDASGGLWIRLTVDNVTRPGYGHAGQKRGGDAIKEAIGDALRNAAMSFGVALPMWMKETPAPVADTAPTPDPVLDETARASLSRNLCLAAGAKKRMNFATVEEEFKKWSGGAKFREAETAQLEGFLEVLRSAA